MNRRTSGPPKENEIADLLAQSAEGYGEQPLSPAAVEGSRAQRLRRPTTGGENDALLHKSSVSLIVSCIGGIMIVLRHGKADKC